MSYSFTQSQEIQRAAAAIENVERAFNTQSNTGALKLKKEQLEPLQELCHMAEKEREEKKTAEEGKGKGKGKEKAVADG